MKRNSGYLEVKIDSNFDDLIKLGIVSPLKRNKTCFYVNSIKMFFKEEDNCYQELIGSKIAKLLNIDSVTYDMVNFITNDVCYRGVMSNDFREEGYELIALNKIIEEYLLDNNKKVLYNDMNLELLEEAFYYHYRYYKNNDNIVKKLLDSIRKSFLLDLLIGNNDNGKYNYALMENNIYAKMTPYFDYGQIFKFTSTRLTVNDSNNYNIYDNLLVFLNNNREYIDFFKEMYDKLTPDMVEKIIKEVEDSINSKVNTNYKSIVFLSCSRHYYNIGTVLDKIMNIKNK